jgi:hypothetical protein
MFRSGCFVLALEHLADSEPVNEILEITLRADLTVLVERYLRRARRWRVSNSGTAVQQIEVGTTSALWRLTGKFVIF